MSKYYAKKLETAILHGVEPGEFVITTIDEIKTLIISLPRSERKDTSVSFTAFVSDAVKYDTDTLIETGFYPVRYNNRILFGFYCGGMVNIISSSYARHVRYGELLDLDRSRFESEVLKHLNHEAAENRKLQKEVKALREGLLGKEPSIDEEVERLVGKKAPKPETVADILSSKEDEEDDDDLY